MLPLPQCARSTERTPETPGCWFHLLLAAPTRASDFVAPRRTISGAIPFHNATIQPASYSRALISLLSLVPFPPHIRFTGAVGRSFKLYLSGPTAAGSTEPLGGWLRSKLSHRRSAMRPCQPKAERRLAQAAYPDLTVERLSDRPPLFLKLRGPRLGAPSRRATAWWPSAARLCGPEGVISHDVVRYPVQPKISRCNAGASMDTLLRSDQCRHQRQRGIAWCVSIALTRPRRTAVRIFPAAWGCSDTTTQDAYLQACKDTKKSSASLRTVRLRMWATLRRDCQPAITPRGS
ncbi:hypothetical protein BV20DRAFT_66287 [Pilatotrama ljubarskyi]|nr:hypothetical protein BV20DRAFT_66287 [Pilatotrama ljubarskyi]